MMETETKRLLAWGAMIFILSPFILYAVPQLVGANESFIVQSGSMEPSIPVGSVIFVDSVEPREVGEGEVITYREANMGGGQDGPVFTTHRVVDVQRQDTGYRFRTKGDANTDPDPGWVEEGRVVGRTMFTIPFIGYVVAWGGTAPGFLVLVLLPAALLIGNEIRLIVREVDAEYGDIASLEIEGKEVSLKKEVTVSEYEQLKKEVRKLQQYLDISDLAEKD